MRLSVARWVDDVVKAAGHKWMRLAQDRGGWRKLRDAYIWVSAGSGWWRWTQNQTSSAKLKRTDLLGWAKPKCSLHILIITYSFYLEIFCEEMWREPIWVGQLGEDQLVGPNGAGVLQGKNWREITQHRKNGVILFRAPKYTLGLYGSGVK